MVTNKPFKGKILIFGMPKRYGIYKIFLKEFEELGFEIIDICFDDENFKYQNFIEKAENFVQKKLYGNKDYKQQLKFQHQSNIEKNIISLAGKADYTLIIRADLYPLDIIEKAKQKSKELIGYQWDGINVFPKVKKSIPLFDRFYVFDPKDVVTKNVLGITNFYFDSKILNNIPAKNVKKFDLYFLGIYSQDRMEYIQEFFSKIDKLKINFKCELLAENKNNILPKHLKCKGITFIDQKFTYEETLNKNHHAKILVDFVNPHHKGLSLRIFEALGNNQKLITNNSEVKKYDFYKPENILVYSPSTLENEIEKFVAEPFQKIETDIQKKYSFENWIKCVLDDKTCNPINIKL